ncbi:hypothetical protein EST38_g14211 [Candolleomyces aberdarensis]|uniref:Uncharacterized protein n=1 Tax=Candolleomyces aberdarensis TaxID=2316362 RepID=A0A4Q2D095_9AGAR|nr:hypothetical protein EST38_g14211 [Candolleomyces aberdarensis]
MNSNNITAFWQERLQEIKPKFTFSPSVPIGNVIGHNSALNQPLVEQAVHILTHNPTLLSKAEVVSQAINQDNHLNDIHSAASIHGILNPFPKDLRVTLQRLIRTGIRDCGDQPLPIWAQTGRELKDYSRGGGRDTTRTVPAKQNYSTMGQLPSTPFTLPSSSSSTMEPRPYGPTFANPIFSEEYQQTSVAIESAIGATHPALDLFYQMNCLKTNIARIDGEIEALSFMRHASVMQVATLRNRYESDLPIPDLPAPPPAAPNPTPSPTKKTMKEPKEPPKEPKEKKPKLIKAEAPSSKVTAKGSSMAKAKETVPKTRAKAAREPTEIKTRAKTQAAPATEGTKGKGKQRAATKPKEVVEKKEIVEEPIKEPVVEKKMEVAEELAKEEGETFSWGDEDIDMEETGAAGEEEMVEDQEDIAEEEEESD